MGPILGQYWLMPILVQHWIEILDQYPVLLGILVVLYPFRGWQVSLCNFVTYLNYTNRLCNQLLSEYKDVVRHSNVGIKKNQLGLGHCRHVASALACLGV